MPGLDRELRQVAVPDLHQYWPLIKPGLEFVREHADGWIAEDVYTAIRTDASTLHVAFIGGHYAAFCVLTVMQGYNCKALHIWCAYNNVEIDIVKEFEPELVKIALDSGCRKITFLSSRKGWERRLKYHGYKPVQTVFEKELTWQAADPQT